MLMTHTVSSSQQMRPTLTRIAAAQLSSSSSLSVPAVSVCSSCTASTSTLFSSSNVRFGSSPASFHSHSHSHSSSPSHCIRRSPQFNLGTNLRSNWSLSANHLKSPLNSVWQQYSRQFSSHNSFSSSSISSSSSSSSFSSPSSFLSSFRRLASLVLNKAPRGFGHFDLDEKSQKKDKAPQSSKDNEKRNEQKDKEKDKDASKDSKGDPFFDSFLNRIGGSSSSSSGGGGGGGSNSGNTGIWNLTLLSLFVLLLYLSTFLESPQEITFQDLRRYLEQGRVKSLQVYSSSKTVRVTLKPSSSMQLGPQQPKQDSDQIQSTFQNESAAPRNVKENDRLYLSIGSIDSFERQLSEAQKELGIDPHDFIPVKYSSGDAASQFFQIFTTLLYIALPLGGLYFMFRMSGLSRGAGGRRGGASGIFNVGKSPATVIEKGEMTKVKFSDVAGLDEAKVEVMEFVEFLRNKEKFEKLGARVPKGALLVGPPGTGKTLLAKAVAGEAGVPFFSISGSDFVEMFVGVGPARVRDLFQQAREKAPCIVFIDEIDAVGRERGRGRFGGGNDERENTLNQLLVEMDGFAPTEGVVVLAGTNRKDILDKALLRAGRFDRQINIDKPDLRGRVEIFKVHLKKVTVQMEIAELATRLAALTPGMTGADIANLCNEAAIIAARHGRAAVHLEDFERASDRIIGGVEKKSLLVNKKEKELVAYHEAGHAVLGWFLEHANPVLKVTIVPRASGALGFAQSLPNELHLYHQDQLKDMMVMTLGGRASEEFFFKRVSTGAADDLTKVNDLAKAQVTKFGMSKRLGQIAFKENEDGFGAAQYSEATAQIIDEEVRLIANSAYERALALVKEYKEKIEALAQRLISSETVNHDMLVEILGERPFQTDSYLEYVKQQRQAQEDIKKQKEKDAQAKESKSTGAHKSDSTSDSPHAPQPAAF